MTFYKIPDGAPCPDCRAELNRFENHEAQALEPVASCARTRGIVYRATPATVFACPACEFVGTADTVRAAYAAKLDPQSSAA